MLGIASVLWGIPPVLWRLFSTVRNIFSTVKGIPYIGGKLKNMQEDNISTVGISSVLWRILSIEEEKFNF